MEKIIALQVEHTHYVPLFPLDRSRERSLSLTTLVDNQKRADLKIYLIVDGKKSLIQIFTIDNLPRQKAGEPRITLKSDFNGRFKLHFTLLLNGELRDSRSVSLRKYLTKNRLSPLLMVLLLLLLLTGGLSLLFLPGRGGSFAPEPTESGTDEQQPAATSMKVESTGERATGTALEEEPAESAVVEGAAAADDAEKEAPPSFEPGQEETETEQLSREASFSMEERIYFKPDSTELTDEARSHLREVARELISQEGAIVHIYGHCALYGTERGRIELSKQRALRVLEFLRALGWSPLREPVIHAEAGNHPVTRDKEEQYLNRRVEIVVTPPDNSSTSRRDQQSGTAHVRFS